MIVGDERDVRACVLGPKTASGLLCGGLQQVGLACACIIWSLLANAADSQNKGDSLFLVLNTCIPLYPEIVSSSAPSTFAMNLIARWYSQAKGVMAIW